MCFKKDFSSRVSCALLCSIARSPQHPSPASPSHSEAFFAYFFSLSTSFSLVLDLCCAWKLFLLSSASSSCLSQAMPTLSLNLSGPLALLTSPQHLLQRIWTDTSGNPCCLRSNNIYTKRYIFRFTWEGPFWFCLFFIEV